MKCTFFLASIFCLSSLLVGCKSKPTKEIQPKSETVVAEDKVEDLVVPTFTMTNIEGKKVSLNSELKKNKITIIDFWATWCGPCMHEVPNLVQIHHDYKDKGLGIVSISLDENEEDWKKTVKEEGMEWTHLSDLKGCDNFAARLYGVQSIPYIIVVDAEGKLLAQDLRGEDLRKFVAERLK